MTIKNNSNEKTNGLIYIKQWTKNKYVTHNQTTTTELQYARLVWKLDKINVNSFEWNFHAHDEIFHIALLGNLRQPTG